MNKLPDNMLVEVTNRCQQRCVFCPRDTMTIKQGEIAPELLERLLQEAYEMGVRKVGLYSTGEMFLCKDIVTHIKNAKKIGYTYVYADTNGALATRENLVKVLQGGLDSIKFSINAGSREIYKKIHGRDDFETVMENLKTCHALKEELGLNYKIMVSCVIVKENEDEVELLRKKVEPYVDEFMAHSVQLSFLRSAEEVERLKPTQYENYVPTVPCPMVFNRIHITYDGFLSACCGDMNHELLLADLNTMSLKDAWNCEKAVRLRERHMKRELSGTMCQCCVNDQYEPYTPLIL